MIIAPSGNKDCGIRMFGILVWIWKLFSHPLFKRPYSLTFCWAWFVTKLNKIQKKKKRCVSDHVQYLTRTTNSEVLKNKRKHKILCTALGWGNTVHNNVLLRLLQNYWQFLPRHFLALLEESQVWFWQAQYFYPGIVELPLEEKTRQIRTATRRKLI